MQLRMIFAGAIIWIESLQHDYYLTSGYLDSIKIMEVIGG